MKVNLGSSKLKKSFFPISFDSSTSSNFGECVPTFMREVVADSHVKLDIRSAVRFAPLSLPTFGKAFLKTYSFYHKFSDLYPPFDNLLTQTPFSTSTGSSYIPSSVPSLPLSYLWMAVLLHSTFSIYKVNSSSVVNNSSSPLNIGRYSVSSFNPSGDVAGGLVATLAYYASKGFSNYNSAFSYLKGSSRATNLLYGRTVSAPCTYIDSSEDESSPVTPSGADFMLLVPTGDLYYTGPTTSGGDFVENLNTNSFSLLFCFKLNLSGKFLRKILLGLGYQIKCSRKSVSLLPLFAYWKSYFNTFAPKRFVNFEQTDFAQVINSLVTNGVSLSRVLFSDSYGSSRFGKVIDELLTCYYTSDSDYYSSQIIGSVNDYGGLVTQDYLAQDTFDGIGVDTLWSGNYFNQSPQLDFSSQRDLGLNEDVYLAHTQNQQNVLNRLTQFVNRRSLLGGKIADLLASVFGIPKSDTFDDSNPYLGSSNIDVDFSDVFSTAETAEGSLGEYAGKATGFGSNDSLKFNCSAPGIVLSFCCVVPRTQHVQGLNPFLFHQEASDFYNPMFDGLTLLPTDRYTLFCVDAINDSFTNLGSAESISFGNQSLFAEYKTTSQGVLNGDLSLMSTKGTYDSFTLDTTIANYVQDISSGKPDIINFILSSPNLQNMTAGTMWRYVGRWLWLGNFDRIFVNTRAVYQNNPDSYDWTSRDTSLVDDNLVIHNVIDFEVTAPMLPLSDSYMTQDLNELGRPGVTSQSE